MKNIKNHSIIMSNPYDGCISPQLVVGSNGIMGGDAGHGSKTTVSIKDFPGLEAVTLPDDSILISFQGDDEIYAFIALAQEAARQLQFIVGIPDGSDVDLF